ncbi:MAG TPA: SDR family NAD(P)-dependent oxidoreductase [Acidimicrobiales bacterium]|nr:SDR family NAD(P)-dependent oxidoreductase [Acidimicrobiales bacterium]
MSELVWVSGASSGIGRALVEAVPWPSARVIGISRRPPEPVLETAAAFEHLALDLADPGAWDELGHSFEQELKGFSGERVVFVHAAGTIDPVGFTAEVDEGAYRDSVLLDSASPQVLGQRFVTAAAELRSVSPTVRCDMVNLTSGAARSVYPGWSFYGAAKAAVDQWTRNVGAEQALRGGVSVLAVAPGTVDTAMQERIRATDEGDFPARQKFVDLFQSGRLTSPAEVAAKMWRLLDSGLDNGSVVDLRDLPA